MLGILHVFCQPTPITELDGTVSGDFFTVLCVGQGFTDDQWMNVYSFSMLRHWLLTYHSSSNSTADTGMTLPLKQTPNLSCHSGSLCHFVALTYIVCCLFRPTLFCFFSSSPANRLQLSLSLSHSFSNGKTREPVDSLCMSLRRSE